MSKKEAYVKKMQAQLDEWGREFEVFKAKAEKAKVAVQADYHKMTEELQAMQKTGGKKLAELKKAGDDTWEDIKKDAKHAWDKMEKALKSAGAKFK